MAIEETLWRRTYAKVNVGFGQAKMLEKSTQEFADAVLLMFILLKLNAIQLSRILNTN